MKCSGNCGKDLENEECVYQVRTGRIGEVECAHHGESEEEFIADSDVGYYCSECLAKGV